MNEHLDANRRAWDRVVPLHLESEFYDVASFKAGRSTLKQVELKEVGDVRGKAVLHLQCHLGLDTLSWAREGAIVTGVDFSQQAIEAARTLAAETGIEAMFLVSDIYALPEKLDDQFDVVFTSYGVLCWLLDLDAWARVVAHFVKPGGMFYIVEFHPFASVLGEDLRPQYSYFPTPQPEHFEGGVTYAVGQGSGTIYEWAHPLGEVITALVEAGLRIEFVHEFPWSPYRFLPFTELSPDGTARMKQGDGSVPLLFSLKASKLG